MQQQSHSQFQAGDVVQLKSGGPPMTVERIESDGSLTCQWFVDKRLVQDVFRPIVLAKYNQSVQRAPI
jgi:uncharacterized protein YodC (DUF2158 family)